MKYGDETELLSASIPIIERLYCWVSGKGFSIADSQQVDQANAEALWTGCKFRPLFARLLGKMLIEPDCIFRSLHASKYGLAQPPMIGPTVLEILAASKPNECVDNLSPFLNGCFRTRCGCDSIAVMRDTHWPGIATAVAVLWILSTVIWLGVAGPIWHASNHASSDASIGFAGNALGAAVALLAAIVAGIAAYRTILPIQRQLQNWCGKTILRTTSGYGSGAADLTDTNSD